MKNHFKSIILSLCLLTIDCCSTEATAETKQQSYDRHDSIDNFLTGNGYASQQALVKFLTQVNTSISQAKAEYFARTYIMECKQENINWDVAFVQMCHETNFLRFGNDVLPSQNNFCGLGATGNGVRGCEFQDIGTGIRAHVQHIKAYASNEPLRNKCVDPRYQLVKNRNLYARTVDQFTGTWATDKRYGESLKNKLETLKTIEQQIKTTRR